MRLSALPKISAFVMSPDLDFIGESLFQPNDVSREPIQMNDKLNVLH